MIAVQAVPEATPFWLTVAVGLGVGSLVGSVAVAATSLIGQWRQRIFERTLRQYDRAHELALKQFEDKQRLRDRQVALLQDGLTEIVQAFIAQSIYIEATTLHTEGADAAMEEGIKHFQAARVKLVLLPAGREMMQAFRDIQKEIALTNTMRQGQKVLVEAQRPAAVEHGERLLAQEQKVMDMTGKAVDRAQQIMEQAAQPVTG